MNNHDTKEQQGSGLKRKTICKILRAKTKSWLGSLPEGEIRNAAFNDAIVTGGCIASMLLGEKVNDFDIYFRTKETTRLIAQHYVDTFTKNLTNRGVEDPKLKVYERQDFLGETRIKIGKQDDGLNALQGVKHFEGGISTSEVIEAGQAGEFTEEIEDVGERYATVFQADNSKKEEDFKPVFMSSNAITLSGGIQLIIRFFGEPDEIHSNYDFAHVLNYWTPRDGELILNPLALEALLSKTLIYKGSRYPLCSIIRIRKFIARGWTINAGQIVKMVLQLGEMNLKNPAVLEDQLTGVDVAYFHQVLELVREKNPEEIDSAYLIEIIDRIFS